MQDTGLPFAQGFLRGAQGRLLSGVDPASIGVGVFTAGIGRGIRELREEATRFEQFAQAFVRDELGETVIQSQVRRGAADTGFDFLSFTGTGRDARLFINEVKQVTGRVRGRSFSVFGLGLSGERILRRNLADARIAIENAGLSGLTRRTLLSQLDEAGNASIRLIGSESRGTVFSPSVLQRIGRTSGFIAGEGFLL